MSVKLVFNNEKDKELLNLSDLKIPIFVDYININTLKGKKEGWKILNYYGTTKMPFIELEDNESKIPFYQENGNAVYQLIKYLDDRNTI